MNTINFEVQIHSDGTLEIWKSTNGSEGRDMVGIFDSAEDAAMDIEYEIGQQIDRNGR